MCFNDVGRQPGRLLEQRRPYGIWPICRVVASLQSGQSRGLRADADSIAECDAGAIPHTPTAAHPHSVRYDANAFAGVGAHGGAGRRAVADPDRFSHLDAQSVAAPATAALDRVLGLGQPPT
jgi:hypothetical protein